MFENLLTSIKNKTNNLADTVKSKSRKLSSGLDSLKNRVYNKPKPSTYYTITPQQDNYDYEYLAPRANCDSYTDVPYMEWVPYVPPKCDEQNIVDRFVRVITVNDDAYINVRRDAFGSLWTSLTVGFCCRDGRIGRRYEGGWPWELKMTIITIGPGGSPACRHDFKVVRIKITIFVLN